MSEPEKNTQDQEQLLAQLFDIISPNPVPCEPGKLRQWDVTASTAIDRAEKDGVQQTYIQLTISAFQEEGTGEQLTALRKEKARRDAQVQGYVEDAKAEFQEEEIQRLRKELQQCRELRPA